MISEINSVNKLHKDGKIHNTLRNRMVLLGVVSLVFLWMIISGIRNYGVEFTKGLYFVFIGFPIGFFIFSKIFVIKWDRVNRVIKVRKFDPVGITTLVAYGILRWYLGDMLGYFYHQDAMLISSISLALLFGVTLGRFSNMLITVNKIHDDLRRAKLLK